MVKSGELELFKMFAGLIADHFGNGAVFLIFEGDTVVWKLASREFDIAAVQTGSKAECSSIIFKAMNEKKIFKERLPQNIYGIRCDAVALPVLDDEDQASGAVLLIFPYQHPVFAAFDNYAPLLAELFPEGSFLYGTDLEKVTFKQASKKFDVPSIQVGYRLKEVDAAAIAIRTNRPVTHERDASAFGVPFLVACYPVYDEDAKNEIIGVFGIVLPKNSACQIREAARHMSIGLNSISSAAQQLTDSASAIHENVQKLDKDIRDIANVADSINKISAILNQLADKSHMLGLNAAIEAARAGEYGKGFEIVAQEIRKLADKSKSTVPQIKQLTDIINEKLQKTNKQSEISLSGSQEQASASEEITASIEELTAISEDLNKIALSV